MSLKEELKIAAVVLIIFFSLMYPLFCLIRTDIPSEFGKSEVVSDVMKNDLEWWKRLVKKIR